MRFLPANPPANSAHYLAVEERNHGYNKRRPPILFAAWPLSPLASSILADSVKANAPLGRPTHCFQKLSFLRNGKAAPNQKIPKTNKPRRNQLWLTHSSANSSFSALGEAGFVDSNGFFPLFFPFSPFLLILVLTRGGKGLQVKKLSLRKDRKKQLFLCLK